MNLRDFKIFFSVILLFTFSLNSCNNSKNKSSKTGTADNKDKLFSIEPRTTTVFWTGYKTTDKKAVKGQFTKLEVYNIKKAKTVREAIDGLKFSIPVSSLFSDEESRDTKLKSFFFGVMDATESLTGTIQVANDSIVNVHLKMNAVSKVVPLTYFVDGQMLSMRGSLNVLDWNAGKALASLHETCKEKHTGADGVSKTWEEVGVSVESYLKVE